MIFVSIPIVLGLKNGRSMEIAAITVTRNRGLCSSLWEPADPSDQVSRAQNVSPSTNLQELCRMREYIGTIGITSALSNR